MARDWTAAWEKVRDEGMCRVCKRQGILEPAHLWSRGNGGDDSPENIVPLCRTCHDRFDGNDRTFDLLPYLTGPEVAQVVHLAASTTNTNGLELARMRLCPRDYAKPIEDARQLAAIDEASAPSVRYAA